MMMVPLKEKISLIGIEYEHKGTISIYSCRFVVELLK